MFYNKSTCVTTCHFFWRLLYRLVLDFSYIFVISVAYGYYMGLTYNFLPKYYMFSLLITIIVSLCTPSYKNDISSFFINVQLYLFLIPMCSLYGCSGRSTIFLIAVTCAHLLQCCIITFSLKRIRHTVRYIRKCSNVLFISLTFFICAVVIGIIIAGGKPYISAFNLNNIYLIRANAVTLNTMMNYFLGWSTKIIVPFLLVYCIYKNKIVFSIILICIQLLFFCIFAQKTYLFTPILIIGVYFFEKYNFLSWGIEKGLSLIVFLSTILYLINHEWIWPVSLMVRRVLYVPATLKFAFYQFFSSNQKVHFADGIIGKIFSIISPYGKEIPKVISEYMGVPNANCNTGYWGDAYANAGWIGLMFFSIIIIIFVKLLDQYSSNLNKSVVIASCSYWIYSLNDAALLTSLLTGGGFVLLFIFMINSLQLRNENKEFEP